MHYLCLLHPSPRQRPTLLPLVLSLCSVSPAIASSDLSLYLNLHFRLRITHYPHDASSKYLKNVIFYQTIQPKTQKTAIYSAGKETQCVFGTSNAHYRHTIAIEQQPTFHHSLSHFFSSLFHISAFTSFYNHKSRCLHLTRYSLNKNALTHV